MIKAEIIFSLCLAIVMDVVIFTVPYGFAEVIETIDFEDYLIMLKSNPLFYLLRVMGISIFIYGSYQIYKNIEWKS